MTLSAAQSATQVPGEPGVLTRIQANLQAVALDAGQGNFSAALAAAENALGVVTGQQSTSGTSAPGSAYQAGSVSSLGFSLPSAGSGVTGSQVVSEAERYLGVPYQWGGTSRATGFDCSGLVQRVYSDLGVYLPRTSQEQAQVGIPISSLALAQPGDLLFFEPGPGGPGHVGIYLGGGEMIDAPYTGTVVQLQQVTTAPCEIRRVLSAAGSGGSAVTGSLAATRALSAWTNAGLPVLPGSAGTRLEAMGVPPGLVSLFETSAAGAGISPELLAAVAKTESGFDPGAVSSAGAQGIMQLMPATAASHGVDPFDPAQAIPAAAAILAGNLQAFGSVPLALAAYNAGAGAVERYGGIPPYSQTQSYVSSVIANMTEA
ncbi:MAG: transglycosylase SLT domain-containing protein [Acidimicrobiales bacterium]